MADNPFSLVYLKLWDMLETSSMVTNLVRVGNRQKFDSNYGPKPVTIDVDKPELILQPESFIADLKATSSTTDITKDYTLFISTGNWDLDKYFNSLSWELIRAVLQWDTQLVALKWNEKSFVREMALTEAEEGTEQDEESRQPQGWAAVWRIQVMMQFLTTDLRLP